MRTEQQLLISMKQVRTERVRLLSMKDKSQLIKLIENLGHFQNTDIDIAWLEAQINSQEKVNS